MSAKSEPTPLPRFIQIEPVGQCNLRCRMCPIQYRSDGGPGQPRAFIDEALFRRLVDQFEGAEELQLQGLGEPMLHPQMCEMISAVAFRGMRPASFSASRPPVMVAAMLASARVRTRLAVMGLSYTGSGITSTPTSIT